MFGRGSPRDAAAAELLTLRQGQRSVMEFAVEFQILARSSGWPPEPLTNVFLHGLADHIRDLLITYPRPSSLDSAISLSIKIHPDQRLQNRCHHRLALHSWRRASEAFCHLRLNCHHHHAAAEPGSEPM